MYHRKQIWSNSSQLQKLKRNIGTRKQQSWSENAGGCFSVKNVLTVLEILKGEGEANAKRTERLWYRYKKNKVH